MGKILYLGWIYTYTRKHFIASLISDLPMQFNTKHFVDFKLRKYFVHKKKKVKVFIFILFN